MTSAARKSGYEGAEAAGINRKSIRPICIGQECTEHWPAEELSAGSDLWRNGELAQPAVIFASRTVRAIEACFEGDRKIVGEEVLRPRAKRDPLGPVVARITIFEPLVHKDRHDGEPLVCLKEKVFGSD